MAVRRTRQTMETVAAHFRLENDPKRSLLQRSGSSWFPNYIVEYELLQQQKLVITSESLFWSPKNRILLHTRLKLQVALTK